MNIKSYLVVGTTKTGSERTLGKFGADERDAAERFALALDMGDFDDIAVRPSSAKPPALALEFRPPFSVEHRKVFSLISDADGRCAAQLVGPESVRNRVAAATVKALGEATKFGKVA